MRGKGGTGTNIGSGSMGGQLSPYLLHQGSGEVKSTSWEVSGKKKGRSGKGKKHEGDIK